MPFFTLSKNLFANNKVMAAFHLFVFNVCVNIYILKSLYQWGVQKALAVVFIGLYWNAHPLFFLFYFIYIPSRSSLFKGKEVCCITLKKL